MDKWFAGQPLPTLRIVGPKDRSDTYVKVEDWKTAKPALTMFIRGGSEATANLPPGTYRLKFATGDQWYGRKYLFGRSTHCQVAGEAFTFEVRKVPDGESYDQWTLELTPQVLGNLKTVDIGIEDF